MLTKNAMGNLINRYRTILTNCTLVNIFGSMALATLMVTGMACPLCVDSAMAQEVNDDAMECTTDITFIDGFLNTGTATFSGDNTTITGNITNEGEMTFDGISTVVGVLTNDGSLMFSGITTLTDLYLDSTNDSGARVDIEGTLKVDGTITWDSDTNDGANQIIVYNGGTLITSTSNMYSYNSSTKEVTWVENLTNADLAFNTGSILSFSGVDSLDMDEYNAVKTALYGNDGFGYESNDLFIFDFGDATLSGLNADDIVDTKPDASTNSNNTSIEWNVPSTGAIEDGSSLVFDSNGSNNITITALNSGSIGSLLFTNVDDDASSLLYAMGGNIITLAGTSDYASLVGATTNSGTLIHADALVGSDTESGTLNLGTANTNENKTGTLNSVTLNSGSTLNVTGSSLTNASGEAITSSFLIADGVTLGDSATLNIDNNALLSVGGTTILGKDSSLSTTGGSTAVLTSLVSGDSSSLSAAQIFVDPSYLGIKEIFGYSATYGNVANQLDVNIYVSEGSLVNLGYGTILTDGTASASELTLLCAKMGCTTKSLATGGLVPTDSTQTMLYVGLGATLTIGSGSLIVDDSVSSYGTLGDGTSPSGVYFGADSFFVANVTSLAQATGTSTGDAVLDGGGAGVYVDASSTLGIVGATTGTYTILTNFTESTGSDLWDYDEATGDIDVFVGNSLLKITDITGSGTGDDPYQVTIGTNMNSALFDGPVGEIIWNVANYQGNTWEDAGFSAFSHNAGVRFVYNVASYGDERKQEPMIEGAAQLSAVAGTNANSYQAARLAMNTQQGRYNLYDVSGPATVNVVTHHADGSIKEEYSGVIQVASNGDLNGVYSPREQAHNSLALWFMPFYGHESVSGMDSGAYSSAYATDLYGVAVGMDKTFTQPSHRETSLVDALRVGLSFNMGGGETNTSGDFDHLENSFDFFGLSTYGSAQFGKFTLSADISYSRNTSDIYQDLSSYGVECLKSDVHTDVWSFGLHGAYTHPLENNTYIIPYLGLELFTIKTADYDVDAQGSTANNPQNTLSGTIFKVESQRQNILSVPLGVTMKKHFALENDWHISPELRLGAIVSMGDLDEQSISRMPGIDGIAHMETQIVDKATFDMGLGFDAMHDNVRLSLDYTLQASPNRTAHGLMGTVEWRF